MIDIRKLKELVRLMVENDLSELDLRDSEEQVTVRRPNALGASQMAPTVAHFMPPAAVVPQLGGSGGAFTSRTAGNGAASTAAEEGSETADDQSNLIRIQSPMVGTFYATANPDSPPFAPVGTPVTPDKVVCIIEAMKIFNEIKAECTGVIHKILAKSGDPVEFGQPLFLVKPD